MRKTLLASVVLVAMAATPALADGGMSAGGYWYVGVGGGVNMLQSTNIGTAFGNTLDTDFDTGWALMANVGYRWGGGLRAELEGAYRKNNAGSIMDVGFGPVTNVDGDVTEFSLMANLLYDIHLGDNLSLTLGGGIGAADSQVQISGFGVPLIVDTGSNNWSFAWQLLSGVSYSMSPNTEFFVEYRYFRNDNHDVTTFPLGTPGFESIDLESQTATFGIRFALGR